MLKLRNKLITVLAVLASLLILSGAILLSSQTAIADQATLDENQATIETSFVVGMEMDIPNANISVGGGSYPATTVYMRDPNGNLQVVSNTFKFEESGIYALVYTAEVDGKLISVEKQITVDNSTYTASKYTKVDPLDNLTVVKNSQEKGIHVSIPYTDRFVWNTPVDLTKTGADNSVITFLPYQYSLEKAGADGITPEQATEIYVRLTDAYDENVYVDVRLEYFLNSNAANQMPSYSAGAAGKAIRAMSENTGRDTREGEVLNVGNGRYYVTYPECAGSPHMGRISESSSLISLYYDIDTNQVFVSQKLYGETDYVKTLINDIDAPEIYGEDAFAGFTTGEVYVSIYTNKFVSVDARVDLEIASIGEMSGEQLSVNTVKDTTAPVLTIAPDMDRDSYRAQIDNGLFVAKGQEVEILDYDVKDVNFLGNKFSVKVLFNNQVNVTLADGKFVPSKVGKYSVIYRAEDDFGNVTEKEIVYHSVDRAGNQNKIIEASLYDTEHQGEIKAGEIINLPKLATISSLNTYLDIQAFAVYGDQEPIEIDLDNPTLKIENVGEYTIVYKYSDIFENGEISYTFTSVAGSVIEIQDPVLPKYFIEGAKYTLDKVYAKTYTTQTPALTEVEYFVSFDGGEYAPCNFNSFTVNDASTLKFKFTYQGQQKETDEITIVDVGFEKYDELGLGVLKKDKYFVGDITTVPYNVSGNTWNYVFVANGTGSAVSMDYANVLSLDNNFSFFFEIPSEYKNFKAVEFELTDYVNRNNSVTVIYSDSGSGTSFEIVNGVKSTVTKAFVGNDFTLQYSKTRGAFVDNSLGLTLPWVSNFESNRVLLKVTLKEVTGSAGIAVASLCGQAINNLGSDEFKPTIYYRSDFSGSQQVGTEVTIFSAVGNDILSPSHYAGKKLVVTVSKINKDNTRDYLVSTDGITLNKVDATREYKVVLQEVADYQVNYAYEDQAPGTGGIINKVNSSYMINIVDQVKPTIEIEGGYNEYSVIEANLNDVFTALSFTVTDNLDREEDLKVCVVVFDPYETMLDLQENEKPFEIEDMKFELKYKGVWTVYYYAEDTTGNVATASYKIYVK